MCLTQFWTGTVCFYRFVLRTVRGTSPDSTVSGLGPSGIYSRTVRSPDQKKVASGQSLNYRWTVRL